MTITKCDICKKTIYDRGEKIEVRLPDFSTYQLCSVCSKKYLSAFMKVVESKSKKVNKKK